MDPEPPLSGAAPSGPRRRCLFWLTAAGVAAAVGVPPRPVVAQPQAAPVDAAAEVATTLARAAITMAAAARSADREIRELLRQTERLASDVRVGTATIAQLTAARQGLLDRLAEKDREFAVDLKILRDGLARLADSPEGAAALARFNEGDVTGALAALEALAEARRVLLQPRRDREDEDDARQEPELARTLAARRRERRGVEDAQPLRDIARLALDAQSRLKLPLEAVIRRFEAVVRLDARVSADSVALARLYRQVGALPAMATAADDAVRHALDADERALAFSEAGTARRLLGEFALAGKHLNQALTLRREAAARQTDRPDLKRLLSVAHERVGELAFDEGRLAEAVAAFERALVPRRELARAADPAPSAQRDLAVALLQLVRAHMERAEVGHAKDLLDEAVREHDRAPSDLHASLDGQRDKAVLLSRQGDLAALAGEPERAERLYRDSLELRERLARQDSGSFRLARDVVVVRVRLADLALRRGGPPRQALLVYQEAARDLRSWRGPVEERSEVERDLVMVDMRVALARWRDGETAPARSRLQGLVDAQSDLDRKRPGQYLLRRDLAVLHRRLGDVALSQQDFDQARRSFEAAKVLGEDLLKADAQARSLRAGLVESLNKLALAFMGLRQPQWAKSAHQRAGRELEQLVRDGRNSLNGVPDSSELIVSAMQAADALDDFSYAERIKTVIGEMRRRRQFSADDESRLNRLKRRVDQ